MPLILRSAALAVAVFLAGYGVLTGYFLSTTQPGNLRGFYDYPSAVWGDGLLLPALAAALTYSIGQLPRPNQHFPAAAAAVVGLLAGVLVIVGWVSDPNPGVNWTMPAPHQLNEAGKGHAAFLMGASALFAALWVEFLHRLRTSLKAPSTRLLAVSVLRSAPFALIVGTTLGYALLAGYDSAQVGTTGAGASSLIALTVSAVFLALALFWAVRGDIGNAAASTMSGVILASGLTVLALAPASTIVAALLTVMAAAAGLAFAMTAEPLVHSEELSPSIDMGTRGSPALEWVAVPALFGIVPLIAQHTQLVSGRVPVSVGVIVLVLAVSVAFRRFRRRTWSLRRDLRWFLVSTVFLGASYGVLVLLQTPNLGFYLRPVLLTITAAALSQIALVKCQADYKRLIELEQSEIRKANSGLATPHELAEMKGIWGRLGGAGVAAAAAIVSLTVSVAPDVGWLPATGEVTVAAASMTLAVVGVIVLACALPQVADVQRRDPAQAEDSPPRPRAGSLPTTYAGSCLLVIAGVLPWVNTPVFHPVAALQAALIAVFMVECILGNGLRLNLVRVGRKTAMLGLLAGAAVFVTVYWALTIGVGSSNGPAHLLSSLLANVGAMFIVGLVTVTGTATAYAHGRTMYLTQYTPVSNAKQDFFLMALLWLVLAWIPQTAAEHISRDDPLHDLKVLVIVLSIIAVCGKTLLWVTKNNDTHSGRERIKAGLDAPDYALPDASFLKRTAALPERISVYLRRAAVVPSKGSARYEAIDGHTAIQNAVALALVGVTLVGALPAIYELFDEYMQAKNTPGNTA